MHPVVKQLINSRSKERKLGLILAGQNRKDINFETLKVSLCPIQVVDYLSTVFQKCNPP